MDGVVSVLDDVHYAKIEQLWDEFEAEFGVRGVYQTPVPHFSYHVAASYDEPKLREIVKQVAAHMPPFIVRTNGLAIFTGADPVLYIPVIRSPAIRSLHESLWERLAQSATDISSYYHPDHWRAHITLAHKEVDHELLPKMIRLLSERSFDWKIQVDNIALISGQSSPHSIKFRVPLEG